MRAAALLLACAAAAAAGDPPRLEVERGVELARLLGPGEWEASGIDVVAGGRLAVVFDDDPRVALVEPDLSRATLVGEPGGDSGHEGIAWDALGRRAWVVVEEARRDDGSWAARLVELDERLARLGQPAWLPIPTAGKNKGIEGLALVRRREQPFLLCLFEGNHGEAKKRGKEVGNGRVEVLRRSGAAWEREARLSLPRLAAFEDYAGIDVEGDRVAVVSQSSAQVWSGRLAPDAWRLVDEGRVLALPEGFDRVEGIAWIDERRLVVCSDVADEDESPAHDQSIHVLRIPD